MFNGCPPLAIVEGNISAGKSTLCSSLAEKLGWVAVLEPTVANPFLDPYYKEPKKWALKLQKWMLHHRFRSYLSAVCKKMQDKSCKGILLDRSIFSDWVFAKKNFDDGNISKEGFDDYMNVRNQMMKCIPFPDAVISLDVSAQECFRRVHDQRQRDCESGIKLEYLEGLGRCYNELMDDFQKNSVNVVRCDSDSFVDAATVAAKLQQKMAGRASVPISEKMMREIVVMNKKPPTFGDDDVIMNMQEIQKAEENLNKTERGNNDTPTSTPAQMSKSRSNTNTPTIDPTSTPAQMSKTRSQKRSPLSTMDVRELELSPEGGDRKRRVNDVLSER